MRKAPSRSSLSRQDELFAESLV